MYQINKIRDIFGPKTVILCVMSGHFVQRGDAAVFDKFTRAEAAVRCGANLVLELPFPFSCASAEYFARAGVHISDCAGADFLVFGSESGDIKKLKRASDIVSGDEFKERVLREKGAGIAGARQRIYSEISGGSDEDSRIMADPNDILAIEYIKAIKELCAGRISPYAIKREGAAYNDLSSGAGFMSATGIRKMIYEGRFNDARAFIPELIFDIFSKKAEKKSGYSSMDNIGREILSFFRLSDPGYLRSIAEIAGGLEYRLIRAAENSTDTESFFQSAHTKKYTDSRIRRAVIYSLTGVTENMLKRLPAYTQVLAADSGGREQIKRIKKSADIEIITKPAGYKKFRGAVRSQFEMSLRADALYTLARSVPEPSGVYLRKSPFIMER